MNKLSLLWWILTGVCMAWYTCVTAYVTVRGAMDIKDMLRHLAQLKNDSTANEV